MANGSMAIWALMRSRLEVGWRRLEGLMNTHLYRRNAILTSSLPTPPTFFLLSKKLLLNLIEKGWRRLEVGGNYD